MVQALHLLTFPAAASVRELSVAALPSAGAPGAGRSAGRQRPHLHLCFPVSLGLQGPAGHFHPSQCHRPRAALGLTSLARTHICCPHTFLIWLGVMPTTSSPKPETSFLSSPSAQPGKPRP